MKIIVYSATQSDAIQDSLGRPEYSYYFVLKEFLPLLEQLGETVFVKDPNDEVDTIYDQAYAKGEHCVFLSFSPPHKTSVDLRCPTITIFAWEFNTIPTEAWDSESRNDWRSVLETLGCAITHSNYAADAVRAAMGPDFPVYSIPAPLWDRFSRIREAHDGTEIESTVRISLNRNPMDSREIDFARIDPLTFEGQHRIENYDYAVSVVKERDAQLKQRNADCAYAESIVRERDAQLEHANASRIYAESVVKDRDAQLEERNAQFTHAEAIVKERDAQLEERNAAFAHAEAIVKERDAELLALRTTPAGKLAQWLLDKKRSS